MGAGVSARDDGTGLLALGTILASEGWSLAGEAVCVGGAKRTSQRILPHWVNPVRPQTAWKAGGAPPRTATPTGLALGRRGMVGWWVGGDVE